MKSLREIYFLSYFSTEGPLLCRCRALILAVKSTSMNLGDKACGYVPIRDTFSTFHLIKSVVADLEDVPLANS